MLEHEPNVILKAVKVKASLVNTELLALPQPRLDRAKSLRSRLPVFSTADATPIPAMSNAMLYAILDAKDNE